MTYKKLSSLNLIIVFIWLAATWGFIYWLNPTFWRSHYDHFLEAQEQLTQNNLHKALDEMSEALAGDPDNVGYLVFAGYIELDLGHLKSAERNLKKALRLNPKNVEALLGLAKAYAAKEKKENAQGILQKLNRAEMSKEQLHRRSQIYSSIGDFELAFQDLKYLIQSYPQDHDLIFEAMKLAAAVQDWHYITSLPYEFIQKYSDTPMGLTANDKIAMALRAQGKYKKAYSLYNQSPSPENLQARAELALQIKNYDTAAKLYGKLVHSRPQNWKNRKDFAYTLYKSGQLEEAQKEYLEIISHGAADTQTRVRFSWLLNELKKYNRAWEILFPLPRPHKNIDVLELQAKTAYWAHRFAEAAKLYKFLVEYNPHDVKTREEYTFILWQLERFHQAIAQCHKLLALKPQNKDYLISLGELYQQLENTKKAIFYYGKAVEISEKPQEILYLRLARLYRGNGKLDQSKYWYELYLKVATDSKLSQQAESEYAGVLLESGHPTQSLPIITSVIGKNPNNADYLYLGAKAASEAKQSRKAFQYLEQLSKLRPLTMKEKIWLAGQYWLVDDLEKALELYEEIREVNSSSEILEAIGDLRFDIGDYQKALNAYFQIGDRDNIDSSSFPPDILLKIARTAVRVGNMELASISYTEYLKARPSDTLIHLEAARFFSSINNFNKALHHYQKVIQDKGSQGLGVEMVKINLALKKYSEAEKWALAALESGEDRQTASLLYAQSLHFQGKSVKAEDILQRYMEKYPHDAKAMVLLAYIAMELDRNLEAYYLFGKAIQSGATEKDKLWFSRGEAARKRGDFSRAARNYSQARKAGLHSDELNLAEDKLRKSTSSTAVIPVIIYRDNNALNITELGLSGSMWLNKAARLTIQDYRGKIEQDMYGFWRNTVILSAENIFLKPEIRAGGNIGMESFDDTGEYKANNLLVGKIKANYYFKDSSHLGVLVRRKTFWTQQEKREPRHFNRIVDLSAIKPDFRIDEVKFSFNKVFQPYHSHWRIDFGKDWYSDENSRSWAYSHWQYQLMDKPHKWLAIRPNIYYESFRNKEKAYFSPRSHFSIGGMVHYLKDDSFFNFEAEFNPQIQITEGEMGFGGHGLFDININFGLIKLGVGIFGFYDGNDNYFLWQVIGHTKIAF